MQKRQSGRCLAILIFLLIFCTLTVHAQQRFSAGPRLGVNLSNYSGGFVSTKPIIGLTAGAFLMYSSLNHFGISADLLYSQKGARFTDFRGDNTIQRINYLDVPIALRYFLTRKGNFRPNLFAGPAVSFKLNATETDKTLGIKQNITNAINAVDLGLLAGFQLNFKGLGTRQRFLIDGRYTYGLPEVFIQPDVNRHNSVFTLTLGYGFGVGPEYRSGRRR